MSEVPKFEEWPKIPRLSRDCIITEKLDGTNASILIADDLDSFRFESGKEVPFLVASRTRWILPENDNYGFAKWAYENADMLLRLGPGHHFGEWWGQGIQRRYNVQEKRFSLFNAGRWTGKLPEGLPSNVGVVPILYEGLFDQNQIDGVLYKLALEGSTAAPGFMAPEGIIIYHKASGKLFKKTIKDDQVAKGNKN